MAETINTNESEEIKEFEELPESEKILDEMREVGERWHHATEDEEAGFRKKIARLESRLIVAREAENSK